MVRVQGCLQHAHRLNHRARLRVVQEVGLLLADAVLSTHGPVYFAHVVHHKGLNHGLGPVLQALVFVARQHDVQVQVSVADVAVAVGQDLLFLWLNYLKQLIVKF